MKEISIQVRGKALHPFSAEDLDALREYHENQILRAKLYGVKKPRSLQQLRLYWAVCGKAAENLTDWKTKEAVDFNIRVALDFRDPSRVAVRQDGTVQFYYRSIAFRNLSHIAACHFFDRAFELIAKKLGVSVDDLLMEAGKE